MTVNTNNANGTRNDNGTDKTNEAAVDDVPAGPGEEQMKAVNRRFITGVTVVTTMDGEHPKGLAVNAFASISLSPPTVMVCVQRTSSTYECLFRASHLAINIMSTEQLDVVTRFATKSADKFAELDWEPGRFGSPLLNGSSARMEVEIRERLQASTHTVFVCRVVDVDVTDRIPMVYSAGGFFDGGALTALS
ncbi:flavin reductase (DIM6/NTAB) family NADH-FMN oxidoreductase RutF [Streptomyces sp. Amel2xB2]|uniref:flavin reductase family protein n=1 Tax=Streptomyces sp. Amel2xB2 TaxID=1305829 RepID=UPI000DBFD29C|nr:flavin reductase family protein [Streptomyces sp. Amel2xB2]RAJ56608.1 flavin reductase (DIM6/NTAB) family NADH-FMN oxidoreductase RutF [Streptomyces sp. Amel2xB2]